VIAEALTRVLEATPAVRLAVLFGSAAAGRLRRGSDIDVAVLVDGPRDQLTPLAVALERATGRPVDLVPLAGAPPLLRFEIARHGTVLLQRQPGEWTTFRARAMRDWWDWAPTARMMHDVMIARLREEAEGVGGAKPPGADCGQT
jgi:uncharacterized protein